MRSYLHSLASSGLGEYLFLALYATFLAIELRPNISADDAAITFRYVERLVTGHGLTYNDHERVLGTSNPLYALILSAIALLGAEVGTAAAIVGTFSFVASTILAAYLARRLGGSRLAGIPAGVVLATDPNFRYWSLFGLESGLAVFLGLLLAIAVLHNRRIAAGIILGLAIWNKLDAGLLALALAIALLNTNRRSLAEIVLVSTATIVPWMLFTVFYYGSAIPQSFIAKLYFQSAQAISPETGFDRLWIWSFLVGDGRLGFVVAAVAMLVLMRPLRLSGNEAVVALTLGAWFLLHFTVFSVMSLGDYYPWYLTALIAPTVILSCALAARLYVRAAPTAYRVPVGAALLLLLFWGSKDFGRATWNDLISKNHVKQWEAFDGDRWLAGVFLQQYAGSSEIVSSAWGWPAFASRLRVNDTSRLNSKAMLAPVMYKLEAGSPVQTGGRGPDVPDGFMPLATFNLASDLYPGYSWFTLFGRPDSNIARFGLRHIQYRLFELSPPNPYPHGSALSNIKLVGTDMHAHPPSGASFVVENAYQPVHIVCTPAFALTTPIDKTDGVTFEILSETRTLYRRHVLAAERLEPVKVELPDARYQQRVRVSFVTGPGPRGDPSYDWAIWKSVKFTVGDAFVDLSRSGNRALVTAWAKHNVGYPR